MPPHKGASPENAPQLAGDVGYQAVFEQAPIGTGLLSAHADGAHYFLRVNTAFAGLLGYTPRALEGKSVADFIHPDDRVAAILEFADDARIARLELRFLHYSGRPIYVGLSYSLVRDETGKPSFFVVQVEDIDAYKESQHVLLAALEQQNEAAQNLRKIDDVRTEMVATISHELRTPLTSILGYVEMLIDGDAGGLNPQQATLLSTIAGSTRRLTDLANDLLALAELDDAAEDSEGGDETVDIGELAAAAVEAARPLIVAKHQVLSVELPSTPLYVKGDPQQLDRALVNLLSNASKYSAAGGHVEVVVHPGDCEVHIVVADDGIGIAKLEQDKLFERFFRASAAQELAIKGTGLGLAIVKSIIDRHGGRIKVESSPGRGASFTVTLPTVVRVSAGHR